MELKKSFPYILIAALLVLLFLKDGKKTPQKPVFIKIPEIVGSFESSQPIHLPIIQKPLGQILSKKETIYIKENENLLKEYQEQNDSLKTELFKKVIQLNNFTSNFEDEHLKLSIKGIVQGEVKELTPTYTIKQRKVAIHPKQVKFRLLAGAEIGNNLLFNKPLFKANVGFQNAKGNILKFSYDTEERIFIGYDFALFKIKN
ncbi:hypothetical protein ACFQZW_12845 [Lutibacter aestuarii]|uniref:Uncharacterized protein n=1 Tax=Lutibacter aestuarii TaxID=861111 RepID=A0ABW2Z8M5_9FLAO